MIPERWSLVKASPNPYRPRAQTLVEFPFETSSLTDADQNLSKIFGQGHTLGNFLQHLQVYENHIYTSFSQPALAIRKVLGYQGPQALYGVDISDMTLHAQPIPETYEQICTYVSGLRLVEKWAVLDKLVHIPESSSVPKSLSEQMLKKSKIRYWDKLEKLPRTLKQLRESAQTLAKRGGGLGLTQIGPQATHLLQLATGQAKLEIEFVRENFRVVALHLSYLLSSHAIDKPGLPDLPKDWNEVMSMLNVQLSAQSDISCIQTFLHSPNATTSRLRHLLQFSLMISPIYLLVPASLRCIKPVGKKTLLQIASALGNQKPALLREFEDAIWNLLRDVVLKNTCLDQALLKLLDSSVWYSMENLCHDEACATFFWPLRTTLVPRPKLHIMAPPAVDGTDEEEEEVARQIEVIQTNEDDHANTEDAGEDFAMDKAESREHKDQFDEDVAMEEAEVTTKPTQSLNRISNLQASMSGKANGALASSKEGRKSGSNSHKRKRESVESLARQDEGNGKASKRQCVEDRPSEGEDDDSVSDERVQDEPGSWAEQWDRIQDEIFCIPPPITLSFEGPKPMIYSAKRKVYVFGTNWWRRWLPQLQIEKNRDFLEKIIAKVLAGCVTIGLQVEGKPNPMAPHIVEPETSQFCIMTKSVLSDFSHPELQEKFRSQHVVIAAGEHTSKLTFRQALMEVTALPLSAVVVDIQDQSRACGPNGDDSLKRGTLEMVAKSAEGEDRILNTLDLPLPYAIGRDKTFYTSDLYALHLTATTSRHHSENPVRVKDFRWTTAATTGAFRTFHIDSDGLGTFITPKCGNKWWVIASPKKGSNFNFASSSTFLSKNFSLSDVPKDWDLEAILLKAGDTLIMRPNTPHAVFTLDSSVCEGGHFFATSLLDHTLHGIVHCLVAGRYISNTYHQSSRFVLREMLAFFHRGLVIGDVVQSYPGFQHLPDPTTDTGRRSLICLCIFGVLCNVLDFSTYSLPNVGDDVSGDVIVPFMHSWMVHDVNAMSPFQRTHCMRTRALALDIIEWLEWRYDMTTWKECFGDSLARVAGCLYAYKLKAESKSEKIGGGTPRCTAAAIETQLKGIFPEGHEYQEKINKEMARLTKGRYFLDPSMEIDDLWKSCDTRQANRPMAYESPLELRTAGISCRDALFIKYSKSQR